MDNPYLANDGVYEQMLMSLPPVQRKQLLEGNWDVNEGAAFVEFDPEVHIVSPFQIPITWERIKGIDYGTLQRVLVYGEQLIVRWYINNIENYTKKA